jgi:hypothetical protein
MTKKQKINQLKKTAENFRGVYLDVTQANKNSLRPFRAKFQKNGVNYSLGYHSTAVEGAKAFNKMAKSLFNGEKAAKAAGYWNNI